MAGEAVMMFEFDITLGQDSGTLRRGVVLR